MRMSREATAQSKARILNAASKMLRERGIEATSIVDVMQATGMTHGGFYRHFQSKDEMVAAAIRAAFDEAADRFDRRLRQHGADAAIKAYVDEYLSLSHLEHAGRGCPIAAIGADAGRYGGIISAEFIDGTEKLIQRLVKAPSGTSRTASERTEAIRRLATLVGAVVMARAVGRNTLRKEILAACS
jgi:TetR/AcrR family transcriptional repressor of nem operon